MVHVWALDDGYGDIKGYTGSVKLLMPSVYTHWRAKMKNELEGDRGSVDPMSYVGVQVEGSDRRFLVGQGALEQDMSANWFGGNNKHEDQGFPIILKASLAAMAQGEETSVVEPLVMGLPVKAEESEDRHKLLESIVLGDHKVTLHLADGRVLNRHVYVKQLITKKQPFGSFCDIILDRDGNIKDRVIASQFNVVVDIGSRTLNIYTLNALEPVTELCETTNDGIYRAYEWVGDFIEERLGAAVPTGKLPYVVKRGHIRGLDLKPAIQHSYETLANEIKKVIESMFVNAWVFVDRVIFTGGGAEVLKIWLEKSFGDKQIMFLDRRATSIGLWKYGKRQMQNKTIAVTKAAPSKVETSFTPTHATARIVP